MVGYATCTAPGATDEVALTRKFAGLELLRFLAAVAVLLWHYQHFFYNVPPGDPTRYAVAEQPLYAALALFYRHGDFAVQVFWAISGFIFFFRYGSAIHEKRVSLREYIVFRLSRLYPLHVVTLVAVALLQLAFMRVNGSGQPFVYQHFDVRHLVLNVMMISQWGLQQGFSFNGPVWSVSVEEFCYIAFFFIASGLAFTRRTLGMLLVSAWVLEVTRVLSPDFAECLALFLLGGVIWGVHRWVLEGGVVRRTTAVAVLLASAVAVGICWSSYPTMHPVVQLAASRFVLIPTLLFAFLALSPRDDSWAGRLYGGLGKLTYSTYMIHFPLQLAAVTILDALGISRAVFYSVTALLLFVAAVMGVGYVLFSRFEMPMQAYVRSRLLPRRAVSMVDREAARSVA
jgi:peptidoglycan/LPS O-acetylase OafA/YrhL